MSRSNSALMAIARCGRQYRDEAMAPFGLRGCHVGYLTRICANPGVCQDQLAKQMLLNKSNVARQVAAMEEEGYIQRTACGKDKRVLRLQLTEKGLSLLPAIGQVMDSWEALLVESLTESEQQILEILLLRLRGNARQALEEVGE